MKQDNLNIAILQYPIVWEDKQANFNKVAYWLETLKSQADLLVLPEMFTTGFSMKAKELSEPNDGETISIIKQWSKSFDIAIAGSFIAREEERVYNRAFVLTPDGEAFFYDKRHLFSIGLEHTVFSAGKEKVIAKYRGWNICLQICYDLRFPVWTRNVANEYDLLLYVANWPASRISSWNALLPARAIENQAYVCGVNRVGEDGLQVRHNGYSSVYDMKGKLLAGFKPEEEGVKITALSLNLLKKFRKNFPVWKDADRFRLTGKILCLAVYFPQRHKEH
jgi:predicted amidohydrolase